MCPIHAVGIARDLGEGREPAFRALLCHPQVASEHLLLLDGVEEDT